MPRNLPNAKTSALAEQGRVMLVGAGPGDAEMLTVKAIKALRRADVVLVDALVGSDVLRYVRPSATIINVGKRGGNPSTPQAHINALMVEHALAGACVVRLKGGDPMVFGRASEEMEALALAGVPYDIVPGVTSGLAAPAALGLAVTDRKSSPGVILVTGHCQADGHEPDWHALARCGMTIVCYMGLGHSHQIANALIAGGLNGSAPVAIIENACTATIRSHITRLDQLSQDVLTHQFRPPSVLVIGDIVKGTAAITQEAAGLSHHEKNSTSSTQQSEDAQKALILLGHGARHAAWADPLHALRKRLQAQLQQSQHNAIVEVAFLSFMQPALPDVLAALPASIKRVDIMPIFWAPGGHVMRELPKLVFEAECRSNVDREIQILPTLSQLPAVLDALVNVAFSALPPDICSN